MQGRIASDPDAVPDTFVEELADIEHVGGGVYRFTFTVTIRTFDEAAREHVVKARLVLSTPAIFRAAVWALRAIGARCCGQFVQDRCTLH